MGYRTNRAYSASAGSMNSPARPHARRFRRVRDREPTAVATWVTRGSEWAGVSAGPFIVLRLGFDYCLAAAWMASTTDSGVPVPAYSVATASLMAPPSSGEVAWSR